MKLFDRETLILPWEEFLEELQDNIIAELRDQCEDLDDTYIETLASRIAQTKVLKQRFSDLAEIVEKLAQEHWGDTDTDSSESASGLRKITIEVTDGMIRNHMLTLTQACKAGIVRTGEKLKLTFPWKEVIQTEIMSPGNRLRERSAIRRIYEENSMVSGDRVILTETLKGRWNVDVWINPAGTAERMDANFGFSLETTATNERPE